MNYARKYSQMLDVKGIDFLLGDVHHKLDGVENCQFDIVFMTYGILCWLNELPKVFSHAAQYLKNRGQFLLIDHHPVLDLLNWQDDRLQLSGQYFYTPLPEKCISTKSYIGSGILTNPTTYQWTHDIGSIVEATIAAGFTIEHFKEYPWIYYKRYPLLVEQQGKYRIPENMAQFPMLFSLLATKNATDTKSD